MTRVKDVRGIELGKNTQDQSYKMLFVRIKLESEKKGSNLQNEIK